MKLIEANIMARGLMNKYGLHNWGLRWMAETAFIGQTNYAEKVIYLSSPWTVLNPARRMKQIVLHEIAHALTGPTAKHGRLWINKCKELGAGHQEFITTKGTGWNSPYDI